MRDIPDLMMLVKDRITQNDYDFKASLVSFILLYLIAFHGSRVIYSLCL